MAKKNRRLKKLRNTRANYQERKRANDRRVVFKTPDGIEDAQDVSSSLLIDEVADRLKASYVPFDERKEVVIIKHTDGDGETCQIFEGHYDSGTRIGALGIGEMEFAICEKADAPKKGYVVESFLSMNKMKKTIRVKWFLYSRPTEEKIANLKKDLTPEYYEFLRSRIKRGTSTS